jgi:NADPH:quinone reductase-like Zn-dependent oxidoreductase
MAVPERLDWPAAGGVPETFTTAHDALFTQCGLLAGERLLVHGGAGGVGTAAIGLAVAAGARVHASVRNEALREQVAALGASVIAPEGFGEHGPFDVILELVGAVNLPENLRALAPEGRIAVIGIGAGSNGELDMRLLMAKRARIHGSMLRARTLEDKAQTARRMERSVLPLLAEGAVGVPVAATFPLSRVADAYEAFTAGGKFGKIVLKMG